MSTIANKIETLTAADYLTTKDTGFPKVETVLGDIRIYKDAFDLIGELVTRDSHGFVSADGATLIDTIHSATGRSVCYGKTLADVQAEYPGAFIQSVADYCAAKAAKQDGEAKEWSEITEERFEEMLNVLPPAAWHRGAFMVGEAVDHHAGTGRPRFSCFKREGGKYFALSSPITHKQFCAIFGDCSSDYIE